MLEDAEEVFTGEVAGPSNAKRPKRLVKFNKNWSKSFNWLEGGKNEHAAKCTICSINFKIGHGGENDVRKHSKTQQHIENLKTNSSTKISSFIHAESSRDQMHIIAAETGFAYHSIIHSQSYVATDCAGKLFPGLFLDSKIAGQYKCGKEKLRKIVTKVLGPESKRILLQSLSNAYYFSVSTDASNKGNVKTFPLVVSYFNKKVGTTYGLLAFYSLDNERSASIFESLVEKITFNNLSMDQVTSFCADNANVNFGKHQSVMVELKKINKFIVPIGCNCHILSNALKKGVSQIQKFEIDVIVIKIFNEFSSSTKCTTELKEIFEWVGCEWSEMLRHIPTRWLSLYPAVERLIKNYEPLKAYFLSKKNTSQTIKIFFESEISMAYLGFVMSFASIFQPIIKALERADGMGVEVYDLMLKVKTSLQSRLDEEFFGTTARSTVLVCADESEKIRFKIEAKNALTVAINYLDKWFDFDENIFKFLKPLNIKKTIPQYCDFEILIKKFNLKNIDGDVLFEELIQLRNFAENNKSTRENTSSSDKVWVQFFEEYPESENILKIIQFAYSIPHGNSSSERVFSLMNIAWRKERSSLLIENLESELMIKENYKMTCQEFRKFLKTDDGQQILIKAKSAIKYQS